MIGKIKQNNSFGKTTRYVLDKEKARLLGGTIAGRDSATIAREFLASRDLNPDVERPVYHLMQSYSYADRDTQILTDETLLDLAIRHFARLTVLAHQPELVKEEGLTTFLQRLEEFLEEELFNYQFFVAHHNDRDHTHTHLVASRISLENGKCIPTYLDHYRNQKVCRQLEREFNLQLLPSIGEVNRRQPSRKQVDRTRAGEPVEVQTQLQNVIDRVAQAQRGTTFEQFIEQLEVQGVEVQITPRGKQMGISYALKGVAMRGSKLGRSYTYAGLQQKYQIGVEQAVEPAPTPQAEAIDRIKHEQAEYANRLTPIVMEIWQRERSGSPNLTTATFELYRIAAQGDQPPELFKHDQRLLHWADDGYQGEGLSLQDCEAIEQFNQFSIVQAIERDQNQAVAEVKEQQQQLERQAWIAAQMQVAIDYFHYQRQANRLRQTPTGQPLANWGDLQIVQRHDQAGEYFALRSTERGDLVRQRSGQAAIETSAGLTATDTEVLARLQRQLESRKIPQRDPVQLAILNPQLEQEQQQETDQARYQRYAEQKTDKILTSEQRDLLVGWKALQAGESRETVEAILIAGSEHAKLVRKQQGDKAGHDYIQQQIAQIMAEHDRQATHPQHGIAEKPNPDRGR